MSTIVYLEAKERKTNQYDYYILEIIDQDKDDAVWLVNAAPR